MHLTSIPPLMNEPAINLLDFKELCIDSLSWHKTKNAKTTDCILVLYTMITFIIMHTVLHVDINCGSLFPPQDKNKGNCNFFISQQYWDVNSEILRCKLRYIAM